MSPDYTTDIVIISYFRREFTKKTLDHLFDRTRLPFRLIVVDNGSTDGTRELLRERLRPNDKLVMLNENRGLESAKSIALEHVKSPRFIDSDNDILVPQYKGECWLERQHALMDEFPDFAAIALRPQILIGVGAIFRDKPAVVENNVCGGSMRLMDTALVKEVGGWRDEFTNRSEEWHICGALKKAGKKVGYARDLFCYHLFGDDNKWGYGDEIKHYHSRDTVDFTDGGFVVDPLTLEPSFKHNT